MEGTFYIEQIPHGQHIWIRMSKRLPTPPAHLHQERRGARNFAKWAPWPTMRKLTEFRNWKGTLGMKYRVVRGQTSGHVEARTSQGPVRSRLKSGPPSLTYCRMPSGRFLNLALPCSSRRFIYTMRVTGLPMRGSLCNSHFLCATVSQIQTWMRSETCA